MTRSPLIPCRHCAGTGKVDLPEHLNAVRLLLIERGGRTAQELAGILETEPTAMNNRLVALFRLGFAVQHRNGKTLYWWAGGSKKMEG